MSQWRLQVAPSAERSLTRLPEKTASAIVEFITGPLLDEPKRVGKPLQRELASYHSARRGAYRIIYRVDLSTNVVRVLYIQHRADAYRRR